jgi:hypothetical protein
MEGVEPAEIITDWISLDENNQSINFNTTVSIDCATSSCRKSYFGWWLFLVYGS